jgi:hypothetical protein
VEFTTCCTDIDVADEAQAGIGNDLGAAREAPVGHEVLHDLDGVRITHLDAAHLVEGHRVPEADQAHLAARVVVEQRGLGRLATGDQRGVGRKLAEEVRLAGAARAQLDVVVVRLHQRQPACDEVHLHAGDSLLGSRPTDRKMAAAIHSSRVNCRAAFCIALEVEARQLDRPQVFDVERVVVFLDVVVRQGHLGPDAAFQQAIVVAVELLADRDALRVEVLQRCPVALLLST